MEIKIKRGLSANLPVLSEGEPGFTTDSKKLFIGTGVENVQITSVNTITLIFATAPTSGKYTVTVVG